MRLSKGVQVAPEVRDAYNRRQRELRALNKAGRVHRTMSVFRDQPDMSQLKHRPDMDVKLPEGSRLLLPVASAAAAGKTPCSGMDPRAFDSGSPDKDLAKAACRSCDIRESCLSAAHDMRASAGIWGGVDFGGSHALEAE